MLRILQVPVGQKDAEKGSVELMEDVPPHKQILAEVLLARVELAPGHRCNT